MGLTSDAIKGLTITSETGNLRRF